jgi:hypothetical protein
LPQDEKPVVEKPVEKPVVEKVKDIPVKPEPIGTPIAIKPKPTTDPSDVRITPKKSVDTTPGNGMAKAGGVEKDKKDKKDAGPDAKPAPGGEEG